MAAAIVAACVDGPTAPGRLGELRFRPIYPAADEPAALGVAPESAAVRITRRTDPASPLVDAMVVYATDTSSLAWIVDLEASSESLDVLVNLWGQGVRLYSGSDAVLVEDGVLAEAAAEPVAVGYVGPPIVTSVTVNPPDVTLDSLGKTTSLQALARDRQGAVVPGAAFGWATDDPGVATVHPVTGVVTAVGGGTATITATSGAASGTALVTVNPTASVASIVVAPSAVILDQVGATQPFAAQAYDAQGQALAGVQFTWASADTGVASIDAASGLASARRHGTTMVSARAGSVVGLAAVTVDLGAAIATVTVTPAAATLAAPGATQPFAAAAFDAGGNPVPVASFAWSSSATDVATVDAGTGLATAVKQGVTAITATVAGKSGSASLTVDFAPSIASITITPPNALLGARDATQQFSALARDAANTVLPGVTFTWTTSAPAVASIDAATGLATAHAHGTATITASSGTVQGTTSLAVNLEPTVDRVVVSPAAVTVHTTTATQQFTAVALDAHDAVVPGIVFAWTSSVPAVGVVHATTGVATAVAHGTTTITATAGSASGFASFIVDLTPTIAAIVVTPPSAELAAVSATRRFSAEARDAAGQPVPGVTFTWTSGTPDVATVDATGLATAVGHGETVIHASAGTITGAALLVVDLVPAVDTIVVSPPAATLDALDQTATFTAVAQDAAGNVLAGVPVVWSSADTGVATVDPATGVAIARANGATVITAVAGSVSGAAALDVAQRVVSIAVTPDSARLTGLEQFQQFAAQAFDVNGHAVANVAFLWSSSNTAVARVDATGRALSLKFGITTITASAQGVTGTAALVVQQQGGSDP